LEVNVRSRRIVYRIPSSSAFRIILFNFLSRRDCSETPAGSHFGRRKITPETVFSPALYFNQVAAISLCTSWTNRGLSGWPSSKGVRIGITDSATVPANRTAGLESLRLHASSALKLREKCAKFGWF